MVSNIDDEAFLKSHMSTTFDLLINTIDTIDNIGMVNAMWDRVSPEEIERRCTNAYNHIKIILGGDVATFSKEIIEYLSVNKTGNKQELYASTINGIYKLLRFEDINKTLFNKLLIDLQALMI